MKQFAVLLSFVVVVVHAVSAAEEDDRARPLASKITEVTVYADRARVTRVAVGEVGAGVATLAWRKLPGWIDEGSVRVSVRGAELLDVQVRKTFLARPEDAELQKAEAAVREVADQIAALDDEARVLDAQARQVDAIRVFSLEKLPKDAASREVKIEEYGTVVKFVSAAMLETAKGKRELERKRRELQPELDARQRQLNELRQKAQLEQRTVLVTVRGSGAGKAELALTYLLPGATWEPVHELRAANGAKEVALASFGVVTQTTGEDWEGVALSLSTQRSTDTIRIPELDKLLVGGGRPVQVMMSSGETFSKANDMFVGQFALWNSVNNGAALQRDVDNNWRVQQVAQARNVERFVRLQEQRGTTAHFAGVGAQTVRTDGRSVRVPIGSAQLAATTKIIAAPEASLNAARTAELVNTGKQPLLPGKVQLYIEGAFVGATETEFVAAGEGFPMFLGVADQIKLSRTLDQKRSSLSWSGKRRRMQVNYLITVENLGDREANVQLGDRVPVSETDDVRVTNVKLTSNAKPDSKGLVKWDVKLAPKQSQEFRVEYLLDYPADYQEQTKSKSAGAARAADLSVEIEKLEMKLK